MPKSRRKENTEKEKLTESDEEDAYATQLENEMVLATDSESADDNETESRQ